MEELIKLENIQVNVEAADWRDAIRKAGKLLEDNGSILNAYTENMIKSVEKLGPYIALMPGFALGHSEPCPDVLKTDISLITLKNPVEFGSPNDPIKVVMCLACTDKEAHISKLQAIALKLMKENAIEDMTSFKEEKGLYDFINE